jgi:hypothetical protein
MMLAALYLSWVNRAELVSRFTDVLSWQTFAIAWLSVMVATTLHEFSHGLTCKHYGGECHEVGFLLLFFIPAFYANVSDAWLFPRKRHRLYVTLAGGYCDLCLWAIATFVWRLTMQDLLVNYLRRFARPERDVPSYASEHRLEDPPQRERPPRPSGAAVSPRSRQPTAWRAPPSRWRQRRRRAPHAVRHRYQARQAHRARGGRHQSPRAPLGRWRANRREENE